MSTEEKSDSDSDTFLAASIGQALRRERERAGLGRDELGARLESIPPDDQPLLTPSRAWLEFVTDVEEGRIAPSKTAVRAWLQICRGAKGPAKRQVQVCSGDVPFGGKPWRYTGGAVRILSVETHEDPAFGGGLDVKLTVRVGAQLAAFILPIIDSRMTVDGRTIEHQEEILIGRAGEGSRS